MENNINNSKKEMPEHIRKMFEQRHSKSGGQPDDLSAPKDEQSEVLNDSEKQTEKDVVENPDENEVTESEIVSDNVTPKANEEEPKPHEDEKNKKKRKLSKKALIILISCISAACILALVLGLVFGLSPRYTKMTTPTVEVHTLSDRTIVSVDKNDNAQIYEFEISFGDNKDTIRSNNSSVMITSYLTQPGQYIVRARYVGDNARENSDYSQAYIYLNYKTLASPTVTLENGLLTWGRVDNAESYYIYYGSDENSPLYLLATQTDGTQNITFDMSALSSQKAGKYYLYVQAVAPANSYYINSDLSAVVEYDNKKNLSAPTDVTYDSDLNTIMMTLSKGETDYKIEIVINKTYTYVYDFKGESTQLTIDLSPYISAQDITSIDVRALGDDEYLISSQIVNVALA